MTRYTQIKAILIFFMITAAGCSSTVNRESTGQFFDSSLATAKIKARLIDDPITGVFRIKVNTFKGRVQLSGFVNTGEEKRRAAVIARQVPGVTSVVNDLIIKRK